MTLWAIFLKKGKTKNLNAVYLMGISNTPNIYWAGYSKNTFYTGIMQL